MHLKNWISQGDWARFEIWSFATWFLIRTQVGATSQTAITFKTSGQPSGHASSRGPNSQFGISSQLWESWLYKYLMWFLEKHCDSLLHPHCWDLTTYRLASGYNSFAIKIAPAHIGTVRTPAPLCATGIEIEFSVKTTVNLSVLLAHHSSEIKFRSIRTLFHKMASPLLTT